MKSRWIMLAAAVVLGVAGAAVAGIQIIGTQQRLEAGAKTVPVLVALEEIPKGTPASELTVGKQVELRSVARKYVVDGAMGSLKGYEDRVLAGGLVPGDQLAMRRFQATSEAGLSYEVPKGKVAITVPVDDVHGSAGFVKPGDRVVVYAAMMSRPPDESTWRAGIMLPHTLVLGVGGKAATGAKGEKTGGGAAIAASTGGEGEPAVGEGKSMTLAVTPADGSRLALVGERGKLWIALEGANDDPAKPGSIHTPDTVLGK